tara:strand:- start:1228 stop:1845 length:618 start_codon:yes stop_codon:yes gene_type:complete
MIYGNISLEILNKYIESKNEFEFTDFDKNLNLDYNEPDKNEVLKLYNIYSNVSNDKKIELAKYYDDPTKIYMNKFFKNNPHIVDSNINKYCKYIQSITRFYIMKYKLKFNAARPFQLGNLYNIDIYPVELLTSQTPSYPSGHAGVYYALFKFFTKIDPTNNYEDIFKNGLNSRVVSGIHFEQDNEAAIKIMNEIFKNDPNLKKFI